MGIRKYKIVQSNTAGGKTQTLWITCLCNYTKVGSCTIHGKIT